MSQRLSRGSEATILPLDAHENTPLLSANNFDYSSTSSQSQVVGPPRYSYAEALMRNPTFPVRRVHGTLPKKLIEDPLPFPIEWPDGMGPLRSANVKQLGYGGMSKVLERLNLLGRDWDYRRFERGYNNCLKNNYARLREFMEGIFARPPNGRTPSGGLRWHVSSPPGHDDQTDDTTRVASFAEIFGPSEAPFSFRKSEGPYLLIFGEHLMQVHGPPWHGEYESARRLSILSRDAFGKQQGATRFSAWLYLELASSGIPEEDLFTSRRAGCKFVLRPNPRPSIPFQRVHIGAQAIPNFLADQACSSMGIHKLLHTLNEVLGTDVQIGRPGVRDCLEYFVGEPVANGCLSERTDSATDGSYSTQSVYPMDFGQAYAHWRTVENDGFKEFLCTIEARQAADEAMRKNAIKETYINNAWLPPRRVWDLLSNRVIPFYLVPVYYEGHIPRAITTVSHSWCHPDHRHSVQTTINGYQWPVPIPKIPDETHNPKDPEATALLERVRVELLNFGAEYAWLDVLCIRQEGRQEHEAQRVEEWKTDIPMIGHIYNDLLPCVTYFNGLGLPLQLDEATLRSKTHWLNRVWTLQEGTRQWLPGGVTGTVLSSEEARTFFQETIQTSMSRTYTTALQAIQERHCTTELDRVHGLAYVIGCKSLPIYDPSMTPGDAWVLLLKHLPDHACRRIAVLHTQCNPSSTSLLPSFEELKTCVLGPSDDPWRILWCDNIGRIGELSQEGHKSDAYIHETKFLGELSVSQPWPGGACSPRLNLCFAPDADEYRIHGRYHPGIRYDVVSLCYEGSLVVEVLGKTVIKGENVPTAVKRGCIHWNDYVWEAYTDEESEKQSIVYVPNTDTYNTMYSVYR